VNSLPQALLDRLVAALGAEWAEIRGARALGGGCINHAMRVETRGGVYLLKWNAEPLPGMFPAELDGLRRLGAVGALRVPRPYAAEDLLDGAPGYILMEWIEPGREPLNGQRLGEGLAELHRRSSHPVYGLERDNYIGSTPQVNGWESDWIGFFREKRLRPQLELAARNGLLTGQRRQRLEVVIDRLERWLGGVSHRPALLHGDLWGGNVMAGIGGEPVLIDPAVYYGDREADLAFTEVFGGFSPRFYAAYRSSYPLEPGYDERANLYNLYHLLNHLNLFGEGYGGSVDAILRRYG
jgi:fructosamine-3-kinase